MEIEELNKLEEKVKSLLNRMKNMHDENIKLKSEIEEMKKQSTLNNQERTQIEKKVTTLIKLIDSIEK